MQLLATLPTDHGPIEVYQVQSQLESKVEVHFQSVRLTMTRSMYLFFTLLGAQLPPLPDP
jgi:hypothetical protein